MTIDLLIHELTPYRVHLLRRFAAEMLGCRFRVLLTLGRGGFDWTLEMAASVPVLQMGAGHDVTRQGRGGSWWREWNKGERLVSELQVERPAAVIMTSYNDVGHLRVLAWCKRNGVPSLLWADSNVRREQATGGGRLLKGLVLPPVLRRFDAVLPWGRLGQEYFRKYGVLDERIIVAPAEPDYAMVQGVSEAAVRASRARLGLSPERRHILFVGRLAREKRVDLLIDAFTRIAAERSAWDLVIVGDGPLRSDLRNLAPSAASRVRWAGPVLDPRALAAVYRACDVFSLPSDYEPWGIVVNEAAAAGLAVVCSDVVGAAAELVRDGVNGRVFPAGDVAALADRLLDVTDPRKVDAMKAATAGVLAAWRAAADPVDGLRRALRSVGVVV